MSVALSEVYWYFALDVDHDVSTDLLELSLDKVNWVEATYAAPSSAAQAKALLDHPVAAGFTRYWWRSFSGVGQDLPLEYGTQTVHGRLTDTPEMPRFAWSVAVSRD